jgi:hypothetical protein
VTAIGPGHVQCKAMLRETGKRCELPAIKGGTVCRKHGGRLRHVRAAAAVRAELEHWGIDSPRESYNAGEILLKLMTQSADRVKFYSDLLQQQYALAAQGEDDASLPAGVGALIGHEYALDHDGVKVPVKEAIRGLVELEGIERDRCATMASKAVAAGLAELKVRLDIRQQQMLADVLRSVVSHPTLELPESKQALVPDLIRERLELIDS